MGTAILGTDQLHTIRTAAQVLRVTEERVRQLVKSGALPSITLGPRLTRIRPSDLSIYIAAGCPAARPARRRA
jgi:excisionase family DNA binding protein